MEKKGDPGAHRSPMPSIRREPNDKTVRLTPSLDALGRGLKPQLNESGTASTPSFTKLDYVLPNSEKHLLDKLN